MFSIYKTIDGKLEKLNYVQNGCWLHLVNPTEEEVNFVSERLEIEKDDILSVLDAEEASRVDYERTYTLVIVDTPIITQKKNQVVYKTIPIAIFSTPLLLMTVCLQDNDVFDYFIKNPVKNFDTSKHTSTILQLLGKNTSMYIQYLRLIDKQSDHIEEDINQKSKNKDLINLLYLEKSLIYFSNSLNSNEIVLDKFRRLKTLNEDEVELLEDVSVENRQALEMTKTYSEILSGMMDFFASLISNNLNMTMKTLTSITLILYIPTLIASLFGMNVPLPLMNNPVALIVIITLSFSISLIGAIIMKWKDLL